MTHCLLSSDRNKKRERETQFVEHRLFKCAAGASYKIETPYKERSPSERFDISTEIACSSKRGGALRKNHHRGEVRRRIFCNRLYAHIDSFKPTITILKKNSKCFKSDTLDESLNARKFLPVIFESKELLVSSTNWRKPHQIFEVREILENIIRFLDRKESSREEAPFSKQVNKHSNLESETSRCWEHHNGSWVKDSQ